MPLATMHNLEENVYLFSKSPKKLFKIDFPWNLLWSFPPLLMILKYRWKNDYLLIFLEKIPFNKQINKYILNSLLKT